MRKGFCVPVGCVRLSSYARVQPTAPTAWGRCDSTLRFDGQLMGNVVMMFDCIVVGAGPAGCAAAYHLALRGNAVLVLDQAPFPRYKPCTGALSPLVAEWFDFDFRPALAGTLRRIRYSWKLGDEVTSELNTQEPIWLVQRDRFDEFLIHQAIAQGATFQDGNAVTGVEFADNCWRVRTARETLQTRYLIAADGATGPMARWLGLQGPQPRAAATYHLPIAQPVQTPALSFEFGLLKHGCLWCFPCGEEWVMGAVSFLGRQNPNFEQAFASYAPLFGAAQQSGKLYRHPVKLWDGYRSLHTHRAVVVGEAAAIADPLSAEGIRHGLYSGLKAAEAIDTALQETPAAIAQYTTAMHEWGNNMQWAQRIASVFFRLPGIGYRVGIKRPTMTRRMGQLLAGEIQYSDVANRVIKRMTTGLIPGKS